ncbi:hypothetical protein KFL_000080570 [Klebsormidium nitens]|uniref:BAG domain-containing protein n=1 Tax=Klebsormidium nitens TaxID=105231 RepID=A0A1Y1HMC7_KLENI|nr:hypothetical protein KFL_000080570 [Klebsormidium nitens]|eukprot:GAQ78151.1 hypothetical protein KFL_000080570 [Klebsormidium nitens]
MATKQRSGYQTADEFYEQYYRDRAREYEDSQTPVFGKGGPVSIKKQNVGILLAMAAAIGAVAFWNKNRKNGTRLGKEPRKPAVARQGLSAGEAAARAAERRLSGHGTNQLTPLGRALAVAQKVDGLEAEAKTLVESVRRVGRVEEDVSKKQITLIELVTQAQIEMDGIQVGESGRAVKKAQIIRMERIIVSLEQLAETAHKGLAQGEVARSSEIQEEQSDGGPS